MSHQMEYLNEVREMQAVSVDSAEQGYTNRDEKPSFEEFVAAKNYIANENEEAPVLVATGKNRDLNEDYE